MGVLIPEPKAEEEDRYNLLGIADMSNPALDGLAALYNKIHAPAPPAPIKPSWDIDNPVGTQRIGDPELRTADPGFRPAAFVGGGVWGDKRPIAQEDKEAIGEGEQWLFDQLALLGPGGAAGPRAAKTMQAAARRPGPRARPGRPRGMPAVDETPLPELDAAPPTVGHNMPPEPTPVAAPPPAAAATVTDIGGGQRGMRAVPSLRSMTPAQAAEAVVPEPHLIPKPDGGYVGAPADVQTPGDILRMRERLDQAIDAGAPGRDWYQQSRDWTSEITGTGFDPNTGAPTHGDPTHARRTAEGLAAFSPQADPGTNLQFYLQARNAWERGIPLPKVRNTQQATTYNTGMAAKDEARAAGRPEPDIKLGPKTEPFGWHLSPDRPYGTTGVNDIWHARSFGYTAPDGGEFKGTPGEAQHMFMDYETVLAIRRANARKAGGFDDWNAATVQAAPWVANKEASLRQRYPKWSDDKVRETALKTYPDFAKGSTAYMPHEQMPGQSTGLLGLVPEDSRAFSNAATWRHPQTGRDTLTGDLFDQGRMPDTTGTYRNSAGGFEMNPAQTAHPLVDFVAGTEPREIHPGTRAALTGSSAARGLLDVQEGTPWHYIDTRPDIPLRDATSMRLTGARPSPAQLEQLQGIADRHGYFLSDTGDGVSLIHGGMEKSPASGIELRDRLKGGLQAEIDAALPGAKLTPGRSQGEYFDLSEELAESMKGKGRATDKVLAELTNMRTQAPRMYDKMMDSPLVAQKAQANLDRLTPEMRAARPDYVKLLGIVAGGNLRALLEHVAKKGSIGLPAALAAFAAGSEQD